MSKEIGRKKAGGSSGSSSPGASFKKEQAEATAAGSKLVAALEAEKKVRSDLETTVAQDTRIIAAMDSELQEIRKVGAEQAELIERLRAVAEEDRKSANGQSEAFHDLGKKYDALEAKKAVDGADPTVLVLLQGIIKHSPNCDTSGGGIMHKECQRGEPCLFRRAKQLLVGHGMEI